MSQVTTVLVANYFVIVFETEKEIAYTAVTSISCSVITDVNYGHRISTSTFATVEIASEVLVQSNHESDNQWHYQNMICFSS